MVAGRGTQFDPTVLDAFLDLGQDALGADTDLLANVSARASDENLAPSVGEPTLTLQSSADDTTVSTTALARAADAAARELDRFSDGREAIECALRVLCEEAGDSVLASVYVLEHDRLWCLAHFRYHQVRDGFDLGQGVLGRTLRTRVPQFVQDVRVDPDFIGAVPGLVSEVAFPLVGESVQGVLNIETTGARLPDESVGITMIT